MCNPGMASIGAQSFGVGMSTMGALFSAQAEKDALKSQANIAEINAKIADSNARAEIERGNWQQSQIRLAGAQMKSAQTARYAASGVDIAGSTSAQAVLTGTDVVTEVDANQARANAIRAAFGQRIEAGNLRRQANSMRATAKGISPFMAAATSLISGAGKVAASWYSLNKEGAFDTAETKTGKVEVDTPTNGLVAPRAKYDKFGRLVIPDNPFPRGTTSFYDFDGQIINSISKWAW